MPKTRTRKLSVTEQLAESKNPSDWAKAARRKTCKLHTLEKIVEKAQAYKESAKNDASLNPNQLHHLNYFICSNQNVSEEILLSKVFEYQLNTNPYSRSYLLRAILENPNTTEKILEAVASNQVFSHPLCPKKKMIDCLNQNSLPEILILAENPSLPLDIQKHLAVSRERKVRQKLSRNLYLDESIIETLMDDPSPIVIRNLVQHPKTNDEIKSHLTEKLKRIGRGRVNKVTLARHSNNEDDLKEYIQEDDYSIAYYATQNKNFSTEHAELGCGHKFKGIRNISKNHEKCSETGKVIAALMD
jgi:hypothetical protein